VTDRVALLMDDYAFFARDPEFFCDRLQTLTTLRGRETVAQWQAMARAGHMHAVVEDLLTHHYDPRYEESMARNFRHYPDAPRWTLGYAPGADSFTPLARTLLAPTDR